MMKLVPMQRKSTGRLSADTPDRRYWHGDAYLRSNANLDQNNERQIPAPFGPAEIDDRRAREFAEAGGIEAAQSAAAPFLKPGVEKFSMPRATFRRLTLPDEIAASASLADAETSLRPYLLGERQMVLPGEGGVQLFAALLIPEGFGAADDAEPAQYWSRNLTDNALESLAARALDRALRREVITGHGLPQETLDQVAAIQAPLNSYRPDKTAEDAQLDLQDRIETGLPAMLTYMLLVIIFGVGNLLLTNTIEERSNKIVETLLSSVTADQLMMGKAAWHCRSRPYHAVDFSFRRPCRIRHHVVRRGQFGGSRHCRRFFLRLCCSSIFSIFCAPTEFSRCCFWRSALFQIRCRMRNPIWGR